MVSWLKLLMLIPYLSVSRETFRQVLQVPDFNIVIWFLLKTDIVIKFENVWAWKHKYTIENSLGTYSKKI